MGIFNTFEGLNFIIIAVFILLSIILFRWFKDVEGKRWRYTLVVAHTIIILFIFVYMLLYGDDAQAGLTWLFAVIIDFPVSLLFFKLPRMGGSQIAWPTIFFVVFGGMQYYFIGKLLDK